MRGILPFLCLAMIVSCGCHRKYVVATPPPAPVPSPQSAPPAITPSTIEPEPAPPPAAPAAKPAPEPSKLELCETSFQAEDYRQAAWACKAYLDNPKSKNRDRALFYLGFSQALAGDSGRDLRQGEDAFRQIIKDFPHSSYKDQASLILGLQAQIDKLRSDLKDRDEQIKKLNDELQVLKEIDLQRRPSRPKE